MTGYSTVRKKSSVMTTLPPIQIYNRIAPVGDTFSAGLSQVREKVLRWNSTFAVEALYLFTTLSMLNYTTKAEVLLLQAAVIHQHTTLGVI